MQTKTSEQGLTKTSVQVTSYFQNLQSRNINLSVIAIVLLKIKK